MSPLLESGPANLTKLARTIRLRMSPLLESGPANLNNLVHDLCIMLMKQVVRSLLCQVVRTELHSFLEQFLP